MELIKSKGYDITTPVIITNSTDFAEVQVTKKGLQKLGKCDNINNIAGVIQSK